jgi:transcriptional regulator with AAA-type ATPase domain
MNKSTLKLFQGYDWPGDIRELQIVVESAVILCAGETFSVDETWFNGEPAEVSGPAVRLATSLDERERELITEAKAEGQERLSGPDGKAAKLGIPRQTVGLKIKSLRINKHQFRVRWTYANASAFSRIKRRISAHDPNGNDGFLDLPESPVQRAFDDKTQEAPDTLCLSEGRAGQNPIGLCPHALRFHC